MASFKDNENREWQVCISYKTVKEARQRFDIKITDVMTDEKVWHFLDDLGHMVEFLWFLVEKQAGEKQIDQDEFYDAMYGDAIDDGINAFMDAMADFFRTPSQRQAARDWWEMAKLIEQSNLLTEREAIKAHDPTLMVNGANGSASNSPESPASTPTP